MHDLSAAQRELLQRACHEASYHIEQMNTYVTKMTAAISMSPPDVDIWIKVWSSRLMEEKARVDEAIAVIHHARTPASMQHSPSSTEERAA